MLKIFTEVAITGGDSSGLFIHYALHLFKFKVGIQSL